MNKELDAAIQAARTAGKILRDGFGRVHEVRFKGPIDIVTKIDHDSEDCLVTLLREISPEYGFLSEERGIIEAQGDAQWIIDPLDGTVNYSRGYPRFCVSIALERSGRIVLGVIYDPLRDELFATSLGGGATMNGHPLVVSSTSSLKHAVVSTGFPYDAWTSDQDNLAEVSYFLKHAMGIRSTGSAALDLAAIACGRRDAHWERGLSAYDIAAGTLLVREAGGVVSDYAGNTDVVHCGEIIAANTAIHSEMLAYLKNHHTQS